MVPHFPPPGLVGEHLGVGGICPGSGDQEVERPGLLNRFYTSPTDALARPLDRHVIGLQRTLSMGARADPPAGPVNEPPAEAPNGGGRPD